MAQATHLRAEDYRAMRWKNGLGVTREIGIYPRGAGLGDPFLWRISSADVGSSGPFSRFPGIDRTLLLLSGNGMRLRLGEGPVATGEEFPGESGASEKSRREVLLSRPFEPVFFSGDGETRGDLVAGPVRDFNVMVDRVRAVSRTRILALPDPAKDLSVPLHGLWALLFVGEGGARAEVPDSEGAGYGAFSLEEGESLYLEFSAGEPGGVRLRALSEGTSVILVEIDRVRAAEGRRRSGPGRTGPGLGR